MILVIGSLADPVIARVAAALAAAGAPFVTVDEDAAHAYAVAPPVDGGSPRWRIRGGDCRGTRAVGAIFVRHEAVNARDRATADAQRRVRRGLDRLLQSTRCTVVNRPACASANYSKPWQLRHMAAAGFLVPRTLVTNSEDAALRFIDELGGRVIFKGVSNLKTAAQVLRPEHLAQLSSVSTCPVQFQEFVAGEDFRVTVVGGAALVTRIVDGEPHRAAPGPDALPPATRRRCVCYTARQGLVVSGIDLRRTRDGRVFAFELNPYPLFTYHETAEQPRITRRVVRYLLRHADDAGDVSV